MQGGWRTMPNGCRVYFSSVRASSQVVQPNYFSRIKNGANYKYKNFESFINPNALCPVCRASVFYYENPAGSKVFFDDLGPPWPKHPCTDNGYNLSDCIGRRHSSSWLEQGWKPLFVDAIDSNLKRNEKLVSAKNDFWSVTFSITDKVLTRNNIRSQHIHSLLLQGRPNAFSSLSVKLHNGNREIPVKVQSYESHRVINKPTLSPVSDNRLTRIELATCGDDYFILSGLYRASEFMAKVKKTEIEKHFDRLLNEKIAIELLKQEPKNTVCNIYDLNIDTAYAFTIQKSNFYSKLQEVNTIQLFKHPDNQTLVLNAVINNKLLTFYIPKNHSQFHKKCSLLKSKNSVLDIIPSDKTKTWYGEYALLINKEPIGLFNNIRSEHFSSIEQYLIKFNRV